MEVGRLIDLFARTSGYIHKKSLQGNVSGALVHTPDDNPESGLILHPFITLFIQTKIFTYWNQPQPSYPPAPSHTHVRLKPFTLRVTFLISSMIHINLPPTNSHCTIYRGFRVISLSISLINFSLGTCFFVTWDQFLEGNGV